MKLKAVALLSGGLDSRLAALLVKRQGVEVVGVAFHSAFYQESKGDFAASASLMQASLGLPVRVLDHTAELVEAIKRPRHGFGKFMNPCIACRARMIRRAARLMAEEGASFAVTGEVLGQRPMSQHAAAMDAIDADAGLEGYVLRPLSALAMAPTVPELEGWVDRTSLEAITGRTRSRQIALAAELGLSDYPSPAGGCLLTHAEFATKVSEALAAGDLDERNAWLFKVGRHFRLPTGKKAIVGRRSSENDELEGLFQPGDSLLVPDTAGPSALLPGSGNQCDQELAGSICAGYMKLDPGAPARFQVRSSDPAIREMEAFPMPQTQSRALLVGIHRISPRGRDLRQR